jgi:hypothetical protein
MNRSIVKTCLGFVLIGYSILNFSYLSVIVFLLGFLLVSLGIQHTARIHKEKLKNVYKVILVITYFWIIIDLISIVGFIIYIIGGERI